MVAVDLFCALGKVFAMLEYWVHWLGFVSGFYNSGCTGYTVQCLTMSGAVAVSGFHK